MSSLLFVALAWAGPMEDVAQRVISQNPTVEAAVAERQRALAAQDEEEHRYLLTVTADATAQRNVSAQFLSGGLVSLQREALSFSAGIAQPFAWGGVASLDLGTTRSGVGVAGADKTIQYQPVLSASYTQPLLQGAWNRVGRQGLRLAKLGVESSRSGYASTASATVRDALRAWSELYDAIAAENVALRSLETARAQEQETETRISVGALAPADRWTFQARTASLEEAWAQSRQLSTVRRATLDQLVGTGVASPPADLALALPDLPPGDPVELAVQASPDVAQARVGVASAEEAASTAGELYRPRLDVGVTAQINGFGDSFSASTTDFGELNGWGGLLTASFSGTPNQGRRLAAVAQGNEQVRAARARAAEVEAAVRASAQAAVANERSAADRTALAEKTAKLAELQVGAARTRLQTGQARAIELREAEDDLADAQRRLIRARVDQLEARLDVLHLTGGLLDRYASSGE